ncbi:MAG: alpha/beta hydrolase, partial [Planctomycetes bacterium]|nr:alpha/beta hydrolase [Planctomycetota bacterium]
MLRCSTALGLGLGLGLGFVLPAQAVPRSGPAAVEHLDVQYAQGVAHDGRRNALDLYLPGGVDHPPLVVFLHGGGWSAGSKDRYAPLGEGLCARGIACAALNTRMFPFVRPDAMVEDCARAFGFLWSHAGDYGYDPERMFLMGHSAGAHLVSWLALDPSKWALTGAPAAALRGVIALSGIYDARPRHRVLDKIFGEEAAARAAASPALLVGDAAPPFQILWAERDIPGLGLTARAFANQLRRHGGAVETLELAGYDHVDYMRALRQPGGGVLLPHVVDYVERLCRARPAPAPAPAWQHGDVQQRLCDPIVGRLPVELFTPARGAARQWLALAADA